ncbi:uncharacterized protein [Engystomops pustulosus]|uniref:uncharacterized protein n=1 Tax=Engystomops pustulosus TaxID=76066 RepID=UPI003AFA61E4
MERSSVPLHHRDNMYQTCTTLHQYNYPSSEGYSSLSPASSIDSSGLSPPYIGYATSQETLGNISMPCSQPMDLKMQPKIPTGKKTKKMKAKLPDTQRQSASEREKMRMRNLSKALQNLRRYLPPSVAPIDKTLTKIETLQLTIRYISLLSEQLGLSEEVLEQRRQGSLQRTRSEQSVSCYMDVNHSLCSEADEERIATTSSQEHIPSTRTPAIDPKWQNMETSNQMHYELYQHPILHVHQPQNHCLETRTALSHPPNDYYVPSYQQMVSCEEYSHLVELWRTEPSHV